MSDDIAKMTLADKLYRTKYEPDSDHSHIEVRQEICARCREKFCVHVCPAEVYKTDPNDPNRIVVSHDNCLECGTCRQACPLGAVQWKHPAGGMGVKYRFG